MHNLGVARIAGKREANKLATRQALLASAKQLFAERGYGAATAKDIAEAAGVTERTLFRYFATKDDLVVHDLMSLSPILEDKIRSRPPHEPPLIAVEQAALEFAGAVAESIGPTPLQLSIDGPPGELLARSGLQLKVEQSIADALRQRAQKSGPTTEDADYAIDVQARCAVGALRAAFIRDWQLRERDSASRPTLNTLIQQAFAIITAP